MPLPEGKGVVTAATVATWVFAAVLVVAGARKLVAPAATAAALHGARLPSNQWLVRLLGLAEMAIGATAMLAGGVLGTGLLGLTYAAFAVFTVRQSRAGQGCGCFGEADAPATNLHVALNVVGAGLAGLATLWPSDSLLAVLGPEVLPALTTMALLIVGTIALQLALTALPELAAAVALDAQGEQS